MIIKKLQGHIWFWVCMLWSAVLVWSGSALGEMKPHFPEDIGKIKKRGHIIVAQYCGVQSGFFARAGRDAPSHATVYADKGQRLVGVDIDLAYQIAEELGVDLKLDRSASSFDAVCHRVALGKADIGISKLSATLKRAQYVRFTVPYARLPICLMVDRMYESKHDIAGRVVSYCRENAPSIGVWKQSAMTHYLREIFPGSQSIPYDNFKDQVRAILDGRVHFVLDDELEVVRYLQSHPELSLHLRSVTIPDRWDSIAVAVSCKSPNLLAFLNLLIEQSQIRQRVEKMLVSN